MGSFQNTSSDDQDEKLYNHIKALDSQLMPLNKNELLKLVFEFSEHLKIRRCFNKEKGMAVKDFYYQFMKRQPDLSLRSAESTSLQREAGFNKEQVGRFFDKLTELMDRHSFRPSSIFNADETDVSVVHKNQLKVMTVMGKKEVGRLTSGERGKTSLGILLSSNASGDQFIPLLFVFPRVRIDANLTKDAQEGSVFDAQERPPP